MTMRKFSKHTPEQIVVKLEKAEALRGEGMSTAQACRVLGMGNLRIIFREILPQMTSLVAAGFFGAATGVL